MEKLLFKPLKKHRRNEIFSIIGKAFDVSMQNPRATIGDFNNSVTPELCELNSATEPLETIEQLINACNQAAIRFTGSPDPVWAHETVRHEQEHKRIALQIEPKVECGYGFIHAPTNDSSGVGCIRYKNLSQLFKTKREYTDFITKTFSSHGSPSEGDNTFLNAQNGNNQNNIQGAMFSEPEFWPPTLLPVPVPPLPESIARNLKIDLKNMR